jgi:hypothetical protein
MGLLVIMTMSQPDLNYITQGNGGNVGAVGSFTGNATCPDKPAFPRGAQFMQCRNVPLPPGTPPGTPPYIQIQQADPLIDGCLYKIVIGNAEFGINPH